MRIYLNSLKSIIILIINTFNTTFLKNLTICTSLFFFKYVFLRYSKIGILFNICKREDLKAERHVEV